MLFGYPAFKAPASCCRRDNAERGLQPFPTRHKDNRPTTLGGVRGSAPQGGPPSRRLKRLRLLPNAGLMQILGLQMRIAAEHFPVFVAGDERDLLNGKAGFEEAACAFMPEVVKVKVFDLEVAALAPERRSNRPSIVRKYPAAAFADTRSLLLNDGAGVVACDVEQRDALVISALPARVLAIPDEEHLFLRVEVCPFNSADFVLPHRGRDSKADDPSDRNFLKGICLESSDQTIQLILRRSSVALIPLPNETKPCERNARQNDGLDREYQRREPPPRATEWS